MKLKARRKQVQAELEPVSLFRAGTLVTGLLGAFGRRLRETRITAFLGHLIALDPERFRPVFGFDGDVASVSLETSEDEGRTDILIETTKGRCVIEAKVSAQDPRRQVSRYQARWRVILSKLPLQDRANPKRGVRYLAWQQLAQSLQKIGKGSKEPLKSYCKELVKHLEEHRMVKKKESPEIYAREINTEETLRLFLNAQIYVCYFEKRNRLAEALYFAPHFGKSISKKHPGVSQGISYIAKIENLIVVESWGQFRRTLMKEMGKPWYKRYNKLILRALRTSWKRNVKKPRSIVFLGTSRLVFNPPVRKGSLQAGSGWLSKRAFSFDTLYAAWEK